MGSGIRHAYNNPKADGADATISRPSNWNEEHIIQSEATGNIVPLTTASGALATDRTDVEFRRARGTLAAPAAVVANDYLGFVRWRAYNTTLVDYSYTVDIFAQADGAPSGNFVPGRLIFGTSDGTGNAVERMRIDKNGKVGIGRTPTNEQFEVAGRAWIQDATQPTMYFGNTLADYLAVQYDPVAKIGYVSAEGATTQLVFRTTAIERMRIDSNGRVNIGSAPTLWDGTTAVDPGLSANGGAATARLVLESTNAAPAQVYWNRKSAGADGFWWYAGLDASNNLTFTRAQQSSGSYLSNTFTLAPTGHILTGTLTANGQVTSDSRGSGSTYSYTGTDGVNYTFGVLAGTLGFGSMEMGGTTGTTTVQLMVNGAVHTTLNATGLGVGGAPSGKFSVVGSNAAMTWTNGAGTPKTWHAYVADADNSWRLVETAVAEHVVVLPGGNTGFGVSPACKVDVAGTARIKGLGQPTTGVGLELSYVAASTRSYQLTYNRDTSTYLDAVYDGSAHIFWASGVEKLRVNATGVGIGNISPGTLLDVNGVTRATTYRSDSLPGGGFFGLDQASAQITLAAAASYDTTSAFSGLIVLNDTTVTGHVALFMVGGAVCTLIAQGGTEYAASNTAGKISVFYNAGVWRILNNTAGSVTLGIATVRTRASS